MRIVKEHRNIIFTALVFGLLYSLISVVNHYYFRTYALDLGAYTNALYDYIRLQWNDSGVFKEVNENLLADHFDLYLIFFSPLSLVLGSYTLLIVQIIAILTGGYGLYLYFKSSGDKRNIALFAALFFYVFFGVFAAISFDYHSNVVAATLIPWFFYLIAKRKIVASSILMLFIIVAKENMPLWLSFICLGLAIEYRTDIYLRRYLLFASVFSIGSFLLITSVIMPAISNVGKYPHFHYSFLGKNFYEALLYIITQPKEALNIFFTNHTHHPNGDFVKLELHILLLTSGLPFLFKKPHYLLMLLPIYFQKLFHDDYSMWGIGGQYSIEFAPVMAIGIFRVIGEFRKKNSVLIMSIMVILLATASTFRTMDNTLFFTDKSRIRFYQKNHYQKDYDVRSVHRQLSAIPEDAKVSAQSPFVPHLSLRDHIYQFPIIKDAEYIVYSGKEGPYPLSGEEFEMKINELVHSKEWEIRYKNGVTILRRTR